MAARWLAFLVWAVVGAASVFWLARLAGGGPSVPAHASVAPPTVAQRGPLSRVLGEEALPVAAAPDAPAASPASSRFKLVGVVAPRGTTTAPAVALIAVDNKPARAYRIGAVVDGDMVLQTVAARSAALGPREGQAQVQLELPPLPPPATGSLPAAGMVSGQPSVPPSAIAALPPGVVPPPPPSMSSLPPGAGQPIPVPPPRPEAVR
jgi:general secretion pathway protein C